MSEIEKKDTKLAPVGSAGFSDFVQNLTAPQFEPVPGCKVCASKFRKEAEEQFERGRNFAVIHRFLKDENGEDISYSSVKNHLTHHFQKEEEAINLKEFAGSLEKWGRLNREDIALFGRYVEFFDMESMELAAMRRSLPISERRKNDELILKFSAVIAQYKELLRKTKDERRPIEVVITSLNKIIQVKLEGSSNPEVKRVLTDIFDQLLREIGDTPLDNGQEQENE